MSQDAPTIDGTPVPAGFWIRLAAYLIDGVALAPISLGGFYAFVSAKSLMAYLLFTAAALLYKPLMESRFGATLGKMACGVRVIDRHGSRITVGAAYLRFAPWLAVAAVGVITGTWASSTPEFSTAAGFPEVMAIMQRSPVQILSNFLSVFVLVDCVTAAFSDQKRAVHDMLAGSYCVRPT